MATKASYGMNPHPDVNPNDDHGWGGYQWPQGVPESLLGVPKYEVHDKKTGELITVVNADGGSVRKELVPLIEKMWELAWLKYDYIVWGIPVPPGANDRSWGPWLYENRKIGGTGTSPNTGIASNHSRAKAMDVNPPNNPQSHVFQSNLPTGLVADWCSLGFYWGGYYNAPTKYDCMHFEYCLTPGDVADSITKVQAMLDALNPVEDDDMSPAAWTAADWSAFDKHIDDRIKNALETKTYAVTDVAGTYIDPKTGKPTNSTKMNIVTMLSRGAIRLVSLTAVKTGAVQDHTVK